MTNITPQQEKEFFDFLNETVESAPSIVSDAFNKAISKIDPEWKAETTDDLKTLASALRNKASDSFSSLCGGAHSEANLVAERVQSFITKLEA